MKKELIIGTILLLFLASSIYALDTEKEDRLRFGHVIFINEIKTNPSVLIPGSPANLSLTLENTGEESISDLRASLVLSDEIAFFNDISVKKILKINSGDLGSMRFQLIPLPNTDEGVYKANLTIDYVTHIGDERQDSYEIGIIVKSTPNLFVKIDDVGVYKGNEIGEITITFVNNNLADIRFLTVELLESDQYEIISANKKYIGDLDSDDFESVSFKIRVKSDQITLPLKMTYKDSLNKDYFSEAELSFDVKTPKELGIKTNGATVTIVLIIIGIIIAYFIYRKIKKKKRRFRLFKGRREG